jgi:hypothetical protein
MGTVSLNIRDGTGAALQVAAEASLAGVLTPHSVPEVAGTPVTGTNPLPTTDKTLTYGAASGNTVLVSAGVAQLLQAAGTTPVRITVVNPLSASDQAISVAERIYVNPVGAAAAGGGGANIPLELGQAITFGPTTGAISWVAATGGHTICAFVAT